MQLELSDFDLHYCTHRKSPESKSLAPGADKWIFWKHKKKKGNSVFWADSVGSKHDAGKAS